MALNFTGRLPAPDTPPPEPEKTGPSRLVLGALVLAAAAFVIALLMFAATRLGPKKPEAPPPLVGVAAPPPPLPPVIAAKPIAAPAPAAPAPSISAAAPSSPAPAPAPSPRDRFIAALRKAPGQITLMVEDDSQAQSYARELQSLFEAAGWTVSWTQAYGSGPAARGMAAALGSTPEDAAVADAFAAAGIPLSGKAPDSGIIQTPELFVGPPLPAKKSP